MDNKISFLTCGGTIDKDYGTGKGIYDVIIGEPYIEEIIKDNKINKKITISNAIKLDSLDIQEKDKKTILKKLLKISTNKIIITHGTDTLIDTAKYIDKNIKAHTKVIILVGASRPGRMKNSDAELNIGYALGVLDVLYEENKLGIYIAMNGEYFNIDNVYKNNKGIFEKINNKL